MRAFVFLCCGMKMQYDSSLDSLQEWPEGDRRRLEAEKARREEVLELRRSLAEQVKRRSRAAARGEDGFKTNSPVGGRYWSE